MKSPVCLVALAPRYIAVVVCWALATVCGPLLLVPSATASTLEVRASDALPGFHRSEFTRYLAVHMEDAGLSGWHFEPALGDGIAADRIEWNFKLNPYAGGEVRHIGGSLNREGRLSAHRPITIEARLYLDGEYQTLVERQAIVEGGPNDRDLAAAVAAVTRDLLGPAGAYRAGGGAIIGAIAGNAGLGAGIGAAAGLAGGLIFDKVKKNQAAPYNADYQAGATGQAPTPPR